MAIDCTGNKTSLVKWADIQELVHQLLIQRANLGLEGVVSSLRDTYPLFQQLTFTQQQIEYCWTFPDNVTSPCLQVLAHNISFGFTPNAAQNWALDNNRLYFRRAAPNTGAPTTTCQCCLVAEVIRDLSKHRLVSTDILSDKSGACDLTADFTFPCLDGSEATRSGLLNTNYIASRTTLTRGRDTLLEVDGFYVVYAPECEGSAQQVEYRYKWYDGAYRLKEVRMSLEGFFTWDIRAADFAAIWSYLNTLRNASCGAKAGAFKYAGTNQTILTGCPVRESDFVWTSQQNNPNATPGCLTYNGSSTLLPWVTNTGGAAPSSCGLEVYCNTLKHLETLIAQLEQLQVRPVGGCTTFALPTSVTDVSNVNVTRYNGGKLDGIYLTSGSYTATQRYSAQGLTYGGEFEAGPGVFNDSFVISITYQAELNPQTGAYVGSETITTRSNYSASDEGCVGSANTTTDHTTNVSGVGLCEVSSWTESGTTFGPFTGPCLPSQGSWTRTYICRGTVSGETKEQRIAEAAAAIANFDGVFNDGGNNNTGITFAEVSDTTVVSVRRVRYKFTIPAGVPVGYRFSWDIIVDGQTITQSYTVTGGESETPVYELPLMPFEGFVSSGPHGIAVQACQPPPAAPSQIQVKPVVRVMKGRETTQPLGANNSPSSFSFSGLPAGLSGNSATGAITGTPTAAGDFSVTVTASNTSGSTSTTFTLSVVNDPNQATPTITQQPTNTEGVVGDAVGLMVQASGRFLSYQWSKNGAEIPGANSPMLAFNSVQTGDAANYSVRIWNAFGEVTSNTVTLTVSSLPTIQSQPQAVATLQGTAATFSVTVAGTGPFTYQWFKDGAPIVSATGSSYTISNVQLADEGSYAVMVTSAVGSVMSNHVELGSTTLPVITLQPLGGEPLNGSSFTLTAAATGRPTPTYQWYKDGVAIGGATSASLVLNPVSGASEGLYRVRVTNAAGFVDSDNVAVTVKYPPTIAQQPIDQTVIGDTNANASFQVIPGTFYPSATFQWYRNNSPLADTPGKISGATTSALTINNVVLADAGDYTVRLTNAVDSVTSSIAKLTVQMLPAFTTHPLTQFAEVGDDVTLTVVATGIPEPTYQWKKGGVDIPGATGTSLVISDIQIADAGSYTCVATNSVGAVTSNAAVVTVGIIPNITSPTGGYTEYVNPGGSFTLTCTYVGYPAPTLQWYKDNVAIPGATSASYTVSSAVEANQGVYYLRIENEHGFDASPGITVDVTNAPVITSHPVSVTANPGANVSFSVTATGTNLEYTWYKDGVAITDPPGSGASTLNINGVLAGNAGSYHVVVENGGGTATSNPATLSVRTAPTIIQHPVSQTVVIGASVTLSVMATGTQPFTYQWTKNNANIIGATSSSLVLSNLSYGDIGSYRCIVTNAVTSVTSNAAELMVFQQPVVTNSMTQQVIGSAGQSAIFTAELAATSETLAFQWKRNGTALTEGAKYVGVTTNSLTIQNVVLSDEGNYVLEVSVLISGSPVGTPTAATASLDVLLAPVITQQPTPPTTLVVLGTSSVVYQITATGEPAPSYQWYHNPGEGASALVGETSSTLELTNVQLSDAGHYYCVVTNVAGSVQSQSVQLTIGQVPSFTFPTGATTINAHPGTTQDLNITVTGDPAPDVAWYKDGVAVNSFPSGYGRPPGSPEDLRVFSVQESFQGVYYAVATNVFGTVQGPNITLDVTNAPIIITQIAGGTYITGAYVTFSVGATSSVAGGPLDYLWKKDGVTVVNWSSNSSYSRTMATVDDSGTYSVDVRNSGGIVTSSAVVTVMAPVAIVAHPATTIVQENNSATLSVVVSGTGPLTYKWYKNGVLINGVNSPNLEFGSASPSDAATYHVEVSNAVSSVISNSALLIVNTSLTITLQPVSPGNLVPDGTILNLTCAATGIGTLIYTWYRLGYGIVGSGPALTQTLLKSNGVSHAYYCEIHDDYFTLQTDYITLNIGAVPVITTPAPGTTQTFSLLPGGGVSFNVFSLPGDPVGIFRWYKNGAIIPGATSSGFGLNNVTEADTGTYYCRRSNIWGYSQGGDLVVDVTDKPSITTDLADATIAAGENHTFTVQATTPVGTSLSYTWYEEINGIDVEISGATSNTLTLTGVQVDKHGREYVVKVTNEAGDTWSRRAVLTVNGAPLITAQPAGATINGGGSHTFTVTAVGPGTLEYQWYKGSNPINDATDDSLVISNAVYEDSGDYRCIVSNSFGGTASAFATLTVNAAPVITTQPQAATVAANGSASFTVQATGAPVLTYQWRKDGSNVFNGGRISGANTPSLQINNLISADAGTYTCFVQNGFGSVLSAGATLTVIQPPVVTQHPVTTLVPNNSSATLTAVVTGTTPMAWQWTRNNVNYGGVGSGLTATVVVPTDNYNNQGTQWRCVFTNSADSVTTDPATVNVGAVAVVTSAPSTQNANPGTTVTWTVTFTGDPTPTVEWQKFSGGIWVTTGYGTPFNLNVSESDAGTYRAKLTNTWGSVYSAEFDLTVSLAPSITANPQSVALQVGQSTTFAVTATGTAPLTYQWRRNGVNIRVQYSSNGTSWSETYTPGQGFIRIAPDGVTFSAAMSYTLAQAGQAANFDLSDIKEEWAGLYDCVVTNAVGSATSSQATLTVVGRPVFGTQPATSVTLPEGATLQLNVAVSGVTPISLQWRKNGVNIPGATGTVFTKNNVTPTDTASYDVVAVNGFGTTYSTASDVTILYAPKITSFGATPASPQEGQNVDLFVTAHGNPTNLTYQWFLGGSMLTNTARIYGVTTENLSIDNAQLSDSGFYRVRVSNSQGEVYSEYITLTVTAAPPIVGISPTAVAVPLNNTTFISVNVTSTAPVLGYQWKKNGTNIPGATGSGLTLNNFQSTDAGIYTCAVTNEGGTTLSPECVVTFAGPPTIDVQPTTQAVTVFQLNSGGAQVTFNLTASGTGPITYQWYFNNIMMGSSNSPSLERVVAYANLGTYHCVVSNAYGSVTSATVYMAAPPLNYTGHNNLTIYRGQPFECLLDVDTNNQPPTVTWSLVSTQIAGATVEQLVSGPNTGKYAIKGTSYVVGVPKVTVRATNEAGYNDFEVNFNAYDTTPSFVGQPTSDDASIGAAWSIDIEAANYPTDFTVNSTIMSSTPFALGDGIFARRLQVGNDFILNLYGTPVSVNGVTYPVTRSYSITAYNTSGGNAAMTFNLTIYPE